MSGELPPLAQHLHDGVLQSLAVARIQLGRALARPGPLPRELGTELRELLDQEIAGLRGLISGSALPGPRRREVPGARRSGAPGTLPEVPGALPANPPGARPHVPGAPQSEVPGARPASRPHLPGPRQPDLSSALAATAAHLQSATGIRISVEDRTAPRGRWAGNDLVAYRILREALHNTAKHSGAKHAWVTVAAGRDRLVGVVSDDGRGFTPAGDRRHFGLTAMYAQARDAGGYLAVQPRSTGTFVTLSLPASAAPPSPSSPLADPVPEGEAQR